VAGIRLSDAATRWGSCTAEGMLRFNWRLVMAPPAARSFVVAHEVAHRVHMDHSPAFHALEARLYDGDAAAARALLRDWSARLRRIGRG
jgi:predicted metal-dependent hydrolase